MRRAGAFLIAFALALLSCRKGPDVPRAGQAWTNSLGMRFVPTSNPQVLWDMCETRAAAFALFVKETHTPWIPPDAETGDDFPAANITWDDAQAFCGWLTQRELAARSLKPGQRYRLPTDLEWSAAAGLAGESGNTPAARGDSDVLHYTWGSAWPPPVGAGNFAGEEAEVDKTEPGNFIAGWHDAYPRLAPVGKFAANRFGLHDLSGNVMEWCDDWFDARHFGRVARGGSWLNGDPRTLSLTHRAEIPPRAGLNVVGFRCVLHVAR